MRLLSGAAIRSLLSSIAGSCRAARSRRANRPHHRRRHVDPVLPLDQITAANFNTLKIAWEWNGKDVPPGVEIGEINAAAADFRRRHADHRPGPAAHRRVARPGHRQDAVDVPGAETPRHDYSMRSNHGKGVVYTRINGRGVV